MVELSAFFMDACEVTRAQFAAFVEDTAFRTQAEEADGPQSWRSPGFDQRPDDPVICVTWYDAVAFCNWRSRRAGLKPCYRTPLFRRRIVAELDSDGFRLPTEAEWEYAARARGLDIAFPWQSDMTDTAELDLRTAARHANFASRGTELPDKWPWTNPVKAFPPNKLGLYGMGGNVWEWCHDWYVADAYAAATDDDAVIVAPHVQHANAPDDGLKIMRGGSFFNSIESLRCRKRGWGLPHGVSARVGFRCVRRARDQPHTNPDEDAGARGN